LLSSTFFARLYWLTTASLLHLLQVIYHLNNKNEDCEFGMQELADQYESEIEQVLKESAAKIDAITEQLRQQEASQRQEAAALQVCDAEDQPSTPATQ
jgi:urease accessory protein UreE